MITQVVTANRLVDGIVVFLAADGGWSERFDLAAVSRSEEASRRLLGIAEQAEADRVVVAPYLIDVREEDGAVRPVRFREHIRAFGPPVHPQFARPGAGA
ncbi:MAG: DUF2849 domain-containing protein [Alphaproteobacteria bacterium]|nr:DUF2849 domain-containing protein [Alphaproteobacteria bacterium]